MVGERAAAVVVQPRVGLVAAARGARAGGKSGRDEICSIGLVHVQIQMFNMTSCAVCFVFITLVKHQCMLTKMSLVQYVLARIC